MIALEFIWKFFEIDIDCSLYLGYNLIKEVQLGFIDIILQTSLFTKLL
jgi:hypothetical protein